MNPVYDEPKILRYTQTDIFDTDTMTFFSYRFGERQRLLDFFDNTEILKKSAKYLRCYTPSLAAEKDHFELLESLLRGSSIALPLAYMYQVAVMM